MTAQPIIHYGVFYRDSKGGIPRGFASIDTTSHETLDSALQEALGLKREGCLILNIFEINLTTGDIAVICDARTVSDAIARYESDSYSTEEQESMRKADAAIARAEDERGAA